jgi:Histone chaperone Rttp106-like
LFEDIAAYHIQHNRPSSQSADEPASKKRKLPNGSLPIHNAPTGQRNTILEAPDISFSIPQRKKLMLGVYHYPSSNTYIVAVKNPATEEIEFELPADQIGMTVRLPVPEKTQRQWNYVLLPRAGAGEEGMLFTVTVGNVAPRKTTGSGRSPVDEAIASAGLELVCPDEDEFSSAIPEAHRKTEKAYHVKAFRGSKDGFLFFLKTGIFFGFKKPLFFVRLEDIESVSYTSVLQRTFNMVISYLESQEEKEVEFSMLDQADYAGINGYVGRHGLSDKSLAEGRRAKLAKKGKEAKVNGPEGAEAEEDDGRTELEKVEAQLQDEEDEMEEDFELDSDDEDSDASGEDDDAYYEDGGDLVKEELGSEAEDVSDEDEEEEEGNEGEEHEGEEEEEAPIGKAKQPVRQAIVPPQRRANEPAPEDDDQL